MRRSKNSFTIKIKKYFKNILTIRLCYYINILCLTSKNVVLRLHKILNSTGELSYMGYNGS